MYAEKPEHNTSVTDQAKDMVTDIKSEVAHEIRHINAAKEPVDPSQSDHVVRRHVAGLSISFFVLILIFLVAVIAGIAIYEHGHHAGAPRPLGVLVTEHPQQHV
jgi:hypothetical protein